MIKSVQAAWASCVGWLVEALCYHSKGCVCKSQHWQPVMVRSLSKTLNLHLTCILPQHLYVLTFILFMILLYFVINIAPFFRGTIRNVTSSGERLMIFELNHQTNTHFHSLLLLKPRPQIHRLSLPRKHHQKRLPHPPTPSSFPVLWFAEICPLLLIHSA